MGLGSIWELGDRNDRLVPEKVSLVNLCDRNDRSYLFSVSRLSITSIEDQRGMAKESSYYHIFAELVFLASLFF